MSRDTWDELVIKALRASTFDEASLAVMAALDAAEKDCKKDYDAGYRAGFADATKLSTAPGWDANGSAV